MSCIVYYIVMIIHIFQSADQACSAFETILFACLQMHKYCKVLRRQQSGMLQVPLALIEGRVTHVLWPPSRMSSVSSFTPPGRL